MFICIQDLWSPSTSFRPFTIMRHIFVPEENLQKTTPTKAPTIGVLRPPNKFCVSMLTAGSGLVVHGKVGKHNFINQGPWQGVMICCNQVDGFDVYTHQPYVNHPDPITWKPAASAFEKVLAMTSQYLSSTCAMRVMKQGQSNTSNPFS